ncbi:multicopper oxidase domain-containing protein [Streptomyces massasporeus]
MFFDADNPGRWMLHCHNAYQGEAWMMTTVACQA